MTYLAQLLADPSTKGAARRGTDLPHPGAPGLSTTPRSRRAGRPARERLWAYRGRHTEAISAAGVPHKMDVTLPLAELAAFEAEVRGRVEAAWPGARTVVFGHLADGNLHVNVLGPGPEDETVEDAVYRLVAAHGGSISAEHGIGIAKTRGAADIQAMAAIKHALDPRGILNPGVLFPGARDGPQR